MGKNKNSAIASKIYEDVQKSFTHRGVKPTGNPPGPKTSNNTQQASAKTSSQTKNTTDKSGN
ncbi:MAG: hypothetical protein ACTSXZ_04300 [Alphaproteobacteria bacterium]